MRKNSVLEILKTAIGSMYISIVPPFFLQLVSVLSLASSVFHHYKWMYFIRSFESMFSLPFTTPAESSGNRSIDLVVLN